MPNIPQGLQRYYRKYLFDSTVQNADFSAGIVRDVPRWQIPDGGAYRLEDVLIDSPGIVNRRGPSDFACNNISVPTSSNPTSIGVVTPNFSIGQKTIALCSNGSSTTYAFDVTSGTPGTNHTLGTNAPSENPPFGEDMVIITDQTLTTAPKTIKWSAGDIVVAALGGSPPTAKVSCVWNAFLLLANTTANPNRIYFSVSGNYEGTWGVSTSFIDVDRPVVALATVGANLLIFTRTTVSRLLGTIPPSASTVGNLSLQPLANVGTIDARSVIVVEDTCYFANEDGVYVTNGASVDSLTTRDDNYGISDLWSSTLANFTPSLGSVVCCGQWQNKWLIVSVINATIANTMFLCYLPNRAWTQITNHNGTMYATSSTPHEKLFMSTLSGGDSTHAALLEITEFFDQRLVDTVDFNGTSIQPLIETRTIVGPGLGLKRFGFGHASYYMPGVSDVMTVKFATGIAETLTFANVDEGSSQAVAAAAKRGRFTVNRDTQGLTLRFQQTTVGGDWSFFGYEVEMGDFFVADGQ